MKSIKPYFEEETQTGDNIDNQTLDKKLERRSMIEKLKSLCPDPYDLANFIHRSNEIERYHLDYRSVYNAAADYLSGYPIKYCTDNPYISSHLSGIYSVILHPLRSIDSIREVHRSLGARVLERGSPGEFRNVKRMSGAGDMYADPDRIVDCLSWLLEQDLDPWSMHCFYEIIHPFGDGNGRSGRIILAGDMSFNFQKINELIDKDYIPNIIKFYGNHKDIIYKI